MQNLRKQRFIQETDGAMGIYGLILFLTICIFCGLSLDVANAYKVRSIVQVAADNAGHTALVTRLRDGHDQAIQNAVDVASENLGKVNIGGVITEDDIEFGVWDPDTRVFTPDPSSISAVKVVAHRDRARGNGVTTFLLSAAGLSAWDVATVSVFETYRPGCLREGFVAQLQVDIQSNNGFENGFCIHSNTSISINQNNYFEAGTIVSMPDLDNLQIAASGFKKNSGLLEALRESFYKIRVLNRIDDIIKAMETGDLSALKTMTAAGSDAGLSYITSAIPVSINSCNVTMSNLTTGRIHKITCANTLSLSGNFVDVAIVTSAPIQFAHGTAFENAVIATKSTDAMSFKGPSGQNKKLTFGKDDGCKPGGGVQLVTKGGAHFAAGLNMYGAQILAAKPINFAANADGIEGVSMISADTVSGTSNMRMGFCGTGMDNNFEVDYYRLAY